MNILISLFCFYLFWILKGVNGCDCAEFDSIRFGGFVWVAV